MEELLLGNDAMKSMDIDVERMIEQFAEASLLDEEKDEFLVGDELVSANPGEAEVLDQFVDEALANGTSSEHVDRLWPLVLEHGDGFRERLDNMH
ncbi:unnamed protein product [Phytophthora fragariaefolia]|uniref:Unnamed protein product n=1 Tax=Phytophthora fragariaefolia TaxID=1490495 RepID=A0A9W6X626_9STRA|nr:unnamed protein product [Phytophthora fragariaefolia]